MNNLSFDEMRKSMVDEQLIGRGINNDMILTAFRKVPRHEFIPDEYRISAYSDYPLPIGESQTISQPYMVALMTESLNLKGGEKVLEIGTGSGYQTAILCEIVNEVYSVERLLMLADNARNVLDRLGYGNYHIKVGDGTLGWEENGPYDGIVVTAGAPGVPESLIKQLKDKGRLVIPMGGQFSQILMIVEKNGRSVRMTEICGCVFVPLVGQEGWFAA